MIKIEALRGFVPFQLVIDERGNIPLPGDEPNQFLLGDYLYHCLDSKKKKEIFSRWCKRNAIILGKTTRTLHRWKDAIVQFQEECAEAKALRRTNFSPEEFLKSLDEKEEDENED